ncbi:hypothetical protein [Deinococcus yavapaiensis]|uniref:Uncharacterized protein n=1 Tax=Deinococcus yavapaiensis KR-236 TaxID=694435 RepID=A0A318SHK1_9DEIO|nr:hypothetical protein [Deinococcus yavapaiensis]PYE53408.1 hypothetical protein DES52_109185 [Deinococcus yavapaiensis KR-236]
MEVVILCEAGNFEQGVVGHVAGGSLGWMKAGDPISCQVAQNGSIWVRHDGHAYQFALHGASDIVEDQQVLLLRIVN